MPLHVYVSFACMSLCVLNEGSRFVCGLRSAAKQNKKRSGREEARAEEGKNDIQLLENGDLDTGGELPINARSKVENENLNQ